MNMSPMSTSQAGVLQKQDWFWSPLGKWSWGRWSFPCCRNHPMSQDWSSDEIGHTCQEHIAAKRKHSPPISQKGTLKPREGSLLWIMCHQQSQDHGTGLLRPQAKVGCSSSVLVHDKSPWNWRTNWHLSHCGLPRTRQNRGWSSV